MNCGHAKLLMMFQRPGRTADLSLEDAAALESHLASCPACASANANRLASDAAIATTMNDVSVPPGLSDRLKDRAALARRRTLWRGAVKYALAASVLIAAYGGYVAATRPTIDLAGLADSQDTLWQTPARTTTDWLAENGLANCLPEDFNLQLVTFTGRRELQGVPTLALRLDANSRQFAWVYFVRTSEFNLRDAQTGQYTSNVAVRVYRDLPGGWTAIVAYTGNNLNAFLRGPDA